MMNSAANKSVKFAIIGCGRIAYRHMEAIMDNPSAQLVALCDLNIARANERKGTHNIPVYQNYREMLQKENVDVVNIMTPSGMHAEHALEVMKKFKKHVVVEKPISLRIDQGYEMVSEAERSGVHIFSVHQNRFNKAIQKIKSAIDENRFGKISLATVRIRWSRGQSYYDRDPWRGTWAFDGGALTNQAIHHIDLLRWLVGDVESVSAQAATQLVNVEVEDTAVALLKFKNGALGAIEATTATRPLNQDLEASISILGEKGSVIVEGAAVNRLTTWTFDDINLHDYSQDPPNVYGFGHNDIINNVVSCVRDGVPPLVTAHDALKTIRLLHALYKSIENGGKEISLDSQPVSSKLGIITADREAIANQYRTPA